MCRIPAGTFQMGGALESPPAHIVTLHPTPVATTLRSFDIDQFEVTAPQAALFLNAHGNDCPGMHAKVVSTETPCVWPRPRNGLEQRDGTFTVSPGHELRVIGHFSIEGAMRYCAWVGKQLATSAQWEYAARHDPRTGRDLIYPWGDRWDPNYTCTERGACQGEWKKYSSIAVAGLFDGTRGRRDGSSPFGVHDTIEGAHEYLIACDDPNETCRPGLPCRCKVPSVVGGQFDGTHTTTYARFVDFTIGSARCVRPHP